MFGESEGKNHLSLYPSISLFTTDLHSLGQYLQEGTRNFFETTLSITDPKLDIKIKVDDNRDGIKYLNGMSLNAINKKAFMGTVAAHTELGKVNNLIIQLDTNDAYHFGYLFIWFAQAVTMGGYLLRINPFDQPGVEAYKKNMFKLLGK
jgi:glucose-6-phosphate isomerase